MAEIRYRIPRVSVLGLLAYAKENEDGFYSFRLSRAETENITLERGETWQEDNALFFQTMSVLTGDEFIQPNEDSDIDDLASVILYLDFSGVFDRDSALPKNAARQKKAESLFRPEGIGLDFGGGTQTYLAFERSASMSRNARLSFVRADVYKALRNRLMLGMKIGNCQLSKLYAYNGLYYSNGKRIDLPELWEPGRIVIIDNPKSLAENVPVITVEDTTGTGPVRHYERVEKVTDIEITEFDGEGLISPAFARKIDEIFCGKHSHTSFQIRMPYIKGMVHEVDFPHLFRSASVQSIRDIWGVSHPVSEVAMILTKSQFKGFGWLGDSRLTFDDYLSACREYRHALYITGVNREGRYGLTDINYQFLNTVSLTEKQFRPADLPLGWDHAPNDDPREWLTKATEQRYYELCADEYERLNFFYDEYEHTGPKGRHMLDLLKANEDLIFEPYFEEKLQTERERILRQYATAHLLVRGKVLYLSGDLIDFLRYTLCFCESGNEENLYDLCDELQAAKSSFTTAYLPGGAQGAKTFALLRNPHIAKNEEVVVSAPGYLDRLRQQYLSGLSGVAMIDPKSLIAERLGGADYDGDMVKVITEPVLVKSIQKNYSLKGKKYKDYSNANNLPLLQIPSATPQIADANDWRARFETVKSTFSSRVGQISNAALDRSILAYDENTDDDTKDQYRQETETLAILTGLEIDSAKSGVKPDLSDYLGTKKVARSRFLYYKTIMEEAEGKRAWYEPSFEEQFRGFFDGVEWNGVSSNVEKLPYYALMLKKNTPVVTRKPLKASELFRFAVFPGWEKEIDTKTLSTVSELIETYESCLKRIRVHKKMMPAMSKKKDIQRVLFMRDQEEQFDVDVLYTLFVGLSPERVATVRRAIREGKWAFLPPDARTVFLLKYLPEEKFLPYYDLFSDFRAGGYRILGDLIIDTDNRYRAEDHSRLSFETDTPDMTELVNAFLDAPGDFDYRASVARRCRELLENRIGGAMAVACAVALGKRKFLWDVLWEEVTPDMLSR